MSEFVTTLNEVNTLAGRFWDREEDVKVRLYVSNPLKTIGVFQAFLVGDPWGYGPKGRFTGPVPLSSLDVPLHDLRRACREMTKVARRARSQLGPAETVRFRLDPGSLTLTCCGKDWRIEGEGV